MNMKPPIKTLSELPFTLHVMLSGVKHLGCELSDKARFFGSASE
jgi:hypothetical protein